jgi:N-methylhydantoinase A
MPAHFSAVGMLSADFRRDDALTLLCRLDQAALAEMDRAYQELEAKGRAALAASEAAVTDLAIHRAADMRYVGQEHTVTVAITPDLRRPGALETMRRAFHAEHERRYSHAAPDEPVELVTLRSAVIGHVAKPGLPPFPAGGAQPPADARRPAREAHFDGAGLLRVEAIFWRDRLRAGNVIAGPALIEEAASVTLVPPGDRARVQEHGHLVLEVGAP